MRPFPMIPLLIVACTPVSDAEIHEHVDLGETRLEAEIPVATLEIDGTEFRFFAWEDGSAGLLQAGAGPLATPVADLLEQVTVAEVFWALSEPGTPIPELLESHHQQMARDWEITADPRFGRQGWLIDELPEQVEVSGSACLNATFNSNICGSSTYPDGPGCFNNLTGSVAWYTGGTSRYRAGVCVQSGSANDWLSYSHYTNQASCTSSCGVAHTIWGYAWNAYPSPHTNLYLNWWWIAPSNAARRSWDHVGSNYSGAVYDWGTKTLDTSNCSY